MLPPTRTGAAGGGGGGGGASGRPPTTPPTTPPGTPPSTPPGTPSPTLGTRGLGLDFLRRFDRRRVRDSPPEPAPLRLRRGRCRRRRRRRRWRRRRRHERHHRRRRRQHVGRHQRNDDDRREDDHVREDRQRNRVPLLVPTLIDGSTTSPNMSRGTVRPPSPSSERRKDREL